MPTVDTPTSNTDVDSDFYSALLQAPTTTTSLPQSFAPLNLPPAYNMSDALARSQQASRLHQMLWHVFTTLLEPRIGLWVCGVGNPFVNANTAVTLSISQLMIELDKDHGTIAHPGHRGVSPGDGAGEGLQDPTANRALLFAIYAYSVRWLHVHDDKQHPDPEEREKLTSLQRDMSESLWTQAQRQIYTVLSRPSYRSVLALYLFAMIPSSPQKERADLADHCLQASLNQQNYLSSRNHTSQSEQDPVLGLLGDNTFAATYFGSTRSDATSEATRAQSEPLASSAYWFSIVSDTTRALTRCRSPVLVSHRNAEAKVWSFVRQRAENYSKQSGPLQRLRTPMSDDQVIAILQQASAFKTLVWAAVTRVQDALMDQTLGDSLAEVVDAVTRESNHFEQMFGTLLCLCQRDFMLLSRTTQICYILLNIHFQVGNLILADALPATFVFIDENLNPYDLRLCACRSIINVLSLALRSDCSTNGQSSTPNILLLDPYPDLMTNAIIRTGSSLFVLHAMQKLSGENVHRMFRVVITALELLSSISYTASEAIPLLRQKLADSGISPGTGMQNDSLHLAAVPIPQNGEFESFPGDGTGVQQGSQNYAVDDLMQELSNTRNDCHSTEELDPYSLDFAAQYWNFEACSLDNSSCPST